MKIKAIKNIICAAGLLLMTVGLCGSENPDGSINFIGVGSLICGIVMLQASKYIQNYGKSEHGLD